jgi:hypothetical protein
LVRQVKIAANPEKGRYRGSVGDNQRRTAATAEKEFELSHKN